MQIQNTNILHEIYPDWKPSDVAFITSIEWDKKNIILKALCQAKEQLNWPNMSKPFFEVAMLFKNVSSFFVNFSGDEQQQVTGFDITDLSANMHDSINFEVRDYESEVISFFCSDVFMLSINALEHPKGEE